MTIDESIFLSLGLYTGSTRFISTSVGHMDECSSILYMKVCNLLCTDNFEIYKLMDDLNFDYSVLFKGQYS